MRDRDNPRPRPLPRIFDHAKYAAAARKNLDERERSARRVYRTQRRRRDAGEIIGYVLIAIAAGFALTAATFALIGLD